MANFFTLRDSWLSDTWLGKLFYKDKGGWYYPKTTGLGTKGEVWIDVTKPFEVYNTVPQVKTIIDRKAAMFSNMQLKIVDIKTGEEKPIDEIYRLLEHPNCSQSQNAWLNQFKSQEQIYGNQFMYFNKPSKLVPPKAIWNISPRYMAPVMSGKVFDQMKMVDIITSFSFKDETSTKPYKTEDILYSKIKDLDNPIIGVSPLIALKYPISNIVASYKFRNTLMARKGGVGILSNESKDSMGAVPLSPEEKKKIADDHIKRYGINEDQAAIILTEASLKWTPMVFPTKQLMLFEEVDANMLTLVDAFGFPIDIFSTTQNSTFENKRQAMKMAFQDTIMPETDQFTQAISPYLNLPEGLKLVGSYEHLPILQADKKTGIEGLKMMIEAFDKAILGGWYTAAEAKKIVDLELSYICPTGD